MEKIPKFTPNPNLKLMDQVRQVQRYHHYALTTERTYCKWILRFIHLYGAGLRLMECVRLRVNILDMDRGLIYVRFGKGGKDRAVPLPGSISGKLEIQLDAVKRIHDTDVADGYGEAWLPEAFARKIGPAARSLGWQYPFPSKKRSIDPRSGKTMRHHVLDSGLQKAVRAAVDRAGLTKRVTCHTFRHSYATHLLESGVNIRIVQEIMGRADLKTTEIYTHVMQKNIETVTSPLDSLLT
jgi:site-specific recombinase XerD